MSRSEYLAYRVISFAFGVKRKIATKILGRRLKIAIATIVKNEQDYLLEWVAYHRLLGFDFFLFYENDSSDDTAKLLKGFEQLGFARAISWPRVKGVAPQYSFMKHSLWKMLNFDWVLYTDPDEFLLLHDHKTVQDLFSGLARAGAVVFHWKVFGTSGLTVADSRPVIERFVRCMPEEATWNYHVKSAIRPSLSRACADNSHVLHTRGVTLYPNGQPVPPAHLEITERLEKKDGRATFETAQLNHYWIKSKEEHVKKRMRGRVDLNYLGPPSKEDLYIPPEVEADEDKAIQRYLPHTKRLMAEMARSMGLDDRKQDIPLPVRSSLRK